MMRSLSASSFHAYPIIGTHRLSRKIHTIFENGITSMMNPECVAFQGMFLSMFFINRETHPTPILKKAAQ